MTGCTGHLIIIIAQSLKFFFVNPPIHNLLNDSETNLQIVGGNSIKIKQLITQGYNSSFHTKSKFSLSTSCSASSIRITF